MDPNNNQQINNQPLQQEDSTPVQQPVPPVAPAPTFVPQSPTPTSAPIPETPKSGGKKGMLLLIILLILVIGMVAYVMFAKNQLNTAQKTSTNNTSVIIPTATTVPSVTPATVEQVTVTNPDADISGIEKDVQGL